MDPDLLVAFGLTLFAGLSTGVGSVLAFVAKKTSTRFLSIALRFSAVVMICVPLAVISFKARTSLVAELGTRPGTWLTASAFFAGIAVISLIERLVPKLENPHGVRGVEDMRGTAGGRKPAKRPRRSRRPTAAVLLRHDGLGVFTDLSAAAVAAPGLPARLAGVALKARPLVDWMLEVAG